MARTIAISLLATDRMSRTFDRASRSTDRLHNSLERIDKVGKMTSLAVGAAGAVALTQALVPLAAAAVALPSAFASLQVVTKTLKVGMVGVGDAMKAVASGDAKKLEEALKKLSPNARAFVKETKSLNKEWTKIQRQVQDNLFVGLDKQLKKTGHAILPTISLGMKSVAADLNRMGVEAAKVMRTEWFKGRVATIFKNGGDAVHTMTGAVRPLLDIVTRLAVMGAPLVKVFAGWAVQGLKSAAAWMKNSKNATKMTVVIANVRDGFARVGNVVRNLLVFFGGLLKASGQFQVSNGDMLYTLEQLTAAMATWSQSAEGQKQLGDIFRLLADVAKQVADILPLIVGPLGAIVKALSSAPGPVREGVVQMLAWSVIISLVVGRLKLLLLVMGGFKAAKAGFDAVNKGIRGMQAATTATRGFIAGFRNVNMAFSSTATRANTLGAAVKAQLLRWKQLTIQMYASAKAAVINAANWVKMKAVAAGTWVANVARAVASWAVAMYRAASAATANAAAQVRAKAAAAGAWIANAARATMSWAVAIGRATAAATANAVASARQRAAVIATTVAQKVAAAASKAWAAAQWLLNAALSANPIGLIIIAIVALGAAFVLAYKKIGWFRTMVDTLFKWFMAAVNFVVNFVKSHWRLLLAIILGPLGIIVGLVIKYWSQIKSFVMSAVNAVIGFVKSHWRLIITVIGGPLGLAVALVTKYWSQIKSFISRTVDAVIGFVKSHWRLIISIVGGPLGAAVALVTKHWSSIKNTTISFWNSIKSHLSSVLNNIKRGFSAAVDGIKNVWNGLKAAARNPVNFVIGIYNNGIRSLVSNLSGLVGKKVNLPQIGKFARGGVMPGYAPGRDSLMAMVSPGESIFRPEFTRAVGSDWVATANALARRQGPQGVRSWLLGGEGSAFARGGVAGHARSGGFAGAFGVGGIVGGLVKGLKNFAFDNVENAVKKAIGKILGGAVPGSGGIHDLIARIPAWIKDKLLGWVKANLDGLAGGKGMKGALAWAKTQNGKPYQWGGNGNPSWDCSGFMSAIESVIRGQKPHRRWATSSFNGGTPPGWHRNMKSGFMIGVLDNGNAHASHTAGTLLGTNVESSGSGGVRVGGGARGYNNGMFPWHYGFKADTGKLTLQRGWNPPVYNGTGRPELLSTDAAAASGEYHFHFHGPVGSRLEMQNWVASTVEDLKRQGRIR